MRSKLRRHEATHQSDSSIHMPEPTKPSLHSSREGRSHQCLPANAHAHQPVISPRHVGLYAGERSPVHGKVVAHPHSGQCACARNTYFEMLLLDVADACSVQKCCCVPVNASAHSCTRKHAQRASHFAVLAARSRAWARLKEGVGKAKPPSSLRPRSSRNGACRSASSSPTCLAVASSRSGRSARSARTASYTHLEYTLVPRLWYISMSLCSDTSRWLRTGCGR